MKIKLLLFLLINIPLYAMQPMQWFRDVAPAIKKEIETEALETAKKDADDATFELILLSQEFNNPLFARQQLIQRLDRLLKRGANPNTEYNLMGLPNNKISMISAAIPRFPEIVELLLQAGADPDSSGISATHIKYSVLFKAIKNNNERIVKLLLQYGANPNFETDTEDTPLLEAISTGNPEIVRLLLQAGADAKGGKKSIKRTRTLTKKIDSILRKFETQEGPDFWPALDLAQEKLISTTHELEQQKYKLIINMLKYPETIERTGLQKLTSEKYELIEPILKGS